MLAFSIWLIALGLYAAFRLWYDNWQGPLTREEIDAYMQTLAALPSAEVNDLQKIREFLEADDGREFVMLNVVRVNTEKIPHPITGEMQPAPQVMQSYFKKFLPVLIRHAGHPGYVARKAGPYIDAWNVEPDPGWTMVGLMRYRSRRDMLKLATDPNFSGSHNLKLAATPNTFSFPTAPRLMLFSSPRIWVGLVLALVAALSHLTLLLSGRI